SHRCRQQSLVEVGREIAQTRPFVVGRGPAAFHLRPDPVEIVLVDQPSDLAPSPRRPRALVCVGHAVPPPAAPIALVCLSSGGETRTDDRGVSTAIFATLEDRSFGASIDRLVINDGSRIRRE